MPNDAEYYKYECVQPYDPVEFNHGAGHICIEPGDKLEVCSVHNPAMAGSVENPQVGIRHLIQR